MSNNTSSFRIGELPSRNAPSTTVDNVVLLGSWGPDSAEAIYQHFKDNFLPKHTIGKLPLERLLAMDREALIGDLARLDFLFGDSRFAKAFEPHVSVDGNGIESLQRADPAHVVSTSLGSSYEKLSALEKGEAFQHIPPALLREESTTGISLPSILQNFQNLRKTLLQDVDNPEIVETMLMKELDQMDLAIQDFKAKGKGTEKPGRKPG